MVRIRSEWRVAAVVGLLLFILLVAFGDRLLGPDDVVVLPFLYVPVIASAVAGSVRITAAITVAAFVASALLLWSTGFDGSTPKRLIAVVVVGTTAIVLARVIGLARIRIAEKDARFRLLAENASDIVARLDRDGTIEWISPPWRMSWELSPQTSSGCRHGAWSIRRTSSEPPTRYPWPGAAEVHLSG